MKLFRRRARHPIAKVEDLPTFVGCRFLPRVRQDHQLGHHQEVDDVDFYKTGCQVLLRHISSNKLEGLSLQDGSNLKS